MRHTRNQPTYAAAERFVKSCLESDDSLFTPGKAIWALPIIEELHRAFVQHPDESSDSFMDKFRRQLAVSSDDAKQLAAEVLWVHFLTPKGTSVSKKLEIIREVLSWMEKPAEIPGDLYGAMDHGFVRGGFAFTTQRPFQLAFLIEFSRHWRHLSPGDAQAALIDPWRFLSVAHGVPAHKGHSQREALLYLVHPDTFEDTISRNALQKIAARWSGFVDDPKAEVHRQVFQIRQRLADDFGADFSFFDPHVLHLWSPDSSRWGQLVQWMRLFFEDPEFDQNERDYKLRLSEEIASTRARVLEEDPDWLEGLDAVLKHRQNNIVPWRTRDTFLDWCREHHAEAASSLRLLWGGGGSIGERVDRFVTAVPAGEAKIGTHSRLTLASYLLMGEDPAANAPYRWAAFRRVMALAGFDPLPDATAGAIYGHALEFLDTLLEEAESRGLSLRDRLDAQSLVWCVHSADKKPRGWSGESWKALQRFREGVESPAENGDADDAPADAASPSALAVLADSLLFDEPSLQRMLDLLEHKKQIIFMGPPGTGKTYVARALARHLAGSQERVTVVQFHPSYAYEDFMEGYRPTLIADRQPGFKIVEGPLRRIARQAATDPSRKHVLIIDEINRGNLAKIFGELYYLLEYRRDEIRLQYSEELFALPGNLYLIGTMNTADRSIALVDVALRRRFHFFSFFPDTPPVQGLLGRWIDRHAAGFEWLARVVDRANAEIADRNFSIGPSHFMDKAALSEDWIRMVWEHSVIPYLEEHFFGEPERLERLKLAVLRKEVGAAPLARAGAELGTSGTEQ